MPAQTLDKMWDPRRGRPTGIRKVAAYLAPQQSPLTWPLCNKADLPQPVWLSG